MANKKPLRPGSGEEVSRADAHQIAAEILARRPELAKTFLFGGLTDAS